MYASTAILAALRHAEATGIGQHIDMALLDAQVAMLASLASNYLVDGQYSGQVPGRMGNAHANVVPYQVFEAAPNERGEPDYLILAVGNDGQFGKFCEVANHPEWAQDDRFKRNADRIRNRHTLVPMIAQVMRTREKSDWLRTLSAAQVPCGPVNDIAEVFNDPHVQARRMVNTWQHPLKNDLDLLASPLKLSETPVQTVRPPPMLGQHTDEVLTEVLELKHEQVAELRRKNVVA
jgi:crotonobetainyl-CoA:carnitine CoA-transferase CaiB-like acyl-CoA transferase